MEIFFKNTIAVPLKLSRWQLHHVIANKQLINKVM